jgi:hypothetical protein
MVLYISWFCANEYCTCKYFKNQYNSNENICLNFVEEYSRVQYSEQGLNTVYGAWFTPCCYIHPGYWAGLPGPAKPSRLLLPKLTAAFGPSTGTAWYFYKFSTYSSLFLLLNIPTRHFLNVFLLISWLFCWLVLGTILSLI